MELRHPGVTRERLRAAGFEGVDVSLEPRPVTVERAEEFLRTVCLGPTSSTCPSRCGSGSSLRSPGAAANPWSSTTCA